MSKFKKGDRVVLLIDTPWCKKGHSTTIFNISHNPDTFETSYVCYLNGVSDAKYIGKYFYEEHLDFDKQYYREEKIKTILNEKL